MRNGLHHQRNCRRFFPDQFDADAKSVVWGWRDPQGALDPVVLNECPVSYITRDSESWVSQFAATRLLRAPLSAGGLLEWPARFVDAFLLLETESHGS